MPMIWNSDAHAKLFVAYMKCHEVKAVNLKGMAEFMGEECSPKAISHQIAALKKKAEAGGATISKASSTPTAKRGKTTALPTPPSSASKSSKKTSSKANGHKRRRDEEDDEVEAQSSAAEKDEEVTGRRPKNYDDIESGDNAGPAVDRSPVRRSASAKPSAYAGMDSSDEDDEAEVLPAKRLKLEDEA